MKRAEIVELRPCGVAGSAARFQASRPPPLAGIANLVAGRLEQVGIGLEAGRQGTPEVDAFLEAVAFLAGQDRAPRGRAGRRTAKRVRKADAFGGDAIEIGRADDWIPGGAGVSEGLVVGNREEEIRARGSALEAPQGSRAGARGKEVSSSHEGSDRVTWRIGWPVGRDPARSGAGDSAGAPPLGPPIPTG